MNKVFLILLLVNLAFSLPDLVKFSDEHKGAKPVNEHPRLKNLFNGLKPNSTGLKRGERVLNGIPASLGQFPHQALLYMFDPKVNGWYLCGGSFIRYNFVLTVSFKSFEKKVSLKFHVTRPRTAFMDILKLIFTEASSIDQLAQLILNLQ